MLHKFVYINLVLTFLACSLPLFPQTYSMSHLGIEQGMTNNYVNAITQDKKGCIWIGTDAGLNMFDGNRFVTYTMDNSKLPGDAINTLLYDAQTDKLWIGTRTGLSIFNCTTRTFEKLPALEKALGTLPNIRSIVFSDDNGIWFALQYAGKIFHYNKRNGQVSIIPILIDGKPNNINVLLDDRKGHLFIGHGVEGLHVYDLKRRTFRYYNPYNKNKDKLPGWRVYCLYQDRAGRIWVGTDGGLSLFNAHTGGFINYTYNKKKNSLLCNKVYDIKEMNDGTLWIATDVGGINILNLKDPASFNPETARFRSITPSYTANGMASANIRNLFQDSFGNIWIGNHSKGLNFIGHTQSPFHLLPAQLQRKPFDPFAVWGLYADGTTVWTGCENGIVGFDKDRTQRVELSPYLTQPHAHVFSITRDGDDLLLGMYRDGLLRLNMKTRQATRVKFLWQDIKVNSFHRMPDNNLWIGTEFGIYVYRNGKLLDTPAVTKHYEGTVYDIQTDRQGKIWVGTYGSGIYIMDKNYREIYALTREKGFLSNVIHQFLPDSKGGLWTATKNGLVYFPDTREPKRYQVYTTRNGLTNAYIHALQEDDRGNLWFSTDKGISCFNRQTNEFKHFDFHSGIPLSSFIDGSTCKTSDGTIYFGSLNGVCYFNPKELETRQTIPAVQIISCTTQESNNDGYDNEIQIPFTPKGIRLNHDQHTFSISFSVPDYALNGMVEYAYTLDGNKWINTQGESAVTFRNLSFGHYTFKVRARLKNQNWDEAHTATVRIYIHPPFYLTWYAWLFYVLLIAGGLFVWLRFYKRKLQLESSLELERKKVKNEQESHKERLRFFTNITHELRTPLTLIIGPLEDLSKDLQLDETYRQKTGVIYQNARRLLSLVNQLLDFRKTETQNKELTVAQHDLNKEVVDIVSRFKNLNRNSSLAFVTRFDAERTLLFYDKEVITTILNNLLSNALKYTPEGTITVSVGSTVKNGTHFTAVSVKDTGYGIEAEALPHIFERYYQAKGKHQASGTGIGLALVKSLAELHECLLNVNSEPGKGSEFTLCLKTDNTYPHAIHKQEQPAPSPANLDKTEAYEADSSVEELPQILVVEDNADIREYISESLNGMYRVWQAADGQEGVKIAKDKIPNLIISDIMMPVMDGIELCREIKSDIYTSHIPVILLTARDTMQDKEEGYESGADSYLTKPFSARLLKARIQNLLNSRKQLAQRISENLKRPSSAVLSDGLNQTDREFLEKLMKIIEENIARELDIDFLTTRLNISRSSLYRKIKGLTGLSGNEFIKKLRLKHSVRLMESGSSISQAAYASGFNDLNHFRLCFKKEYGVTPSEYMKQDSHE